MATPSCEKCNHHYSTATHFHAWNIDWEKVKPRMSLESLSMLKYNYLCDKCKKPFKKELMRITTFDDLKAGETINKKPPKECYEEFGSDLDGCSRQQNEGCNGCRCLEEIKTVVNTKDLCLYCEKSPDNKNTLCYVFSRTGVCEYTPRVEEDN